MTPIPNLSMTDQTSQTAATGGIFFNPLGINKTTQDNTFKIGIIIVGVFAAYVIAKKAKLL